MSEDKVKAEVSGVEGVVGTGDVLVTDGVLGTDGQNGVSLSEKIAQLDRLAEWFYSDDFRLEGAMERYQEATQLAREIEDDLVNLKNEIEVLAEDFSK